MKIKKNIEIDLKIPKFEVDDYINQELLHFDALNHLNKTSFNVIIGRSGSGKTSLLLSMLTNKKPNIFRKQYENIYVVMPPQSRASLKNNIFDKYILQKNLYDDLTLEAMMNIFVRIEENSNEDEKTLLILDDVASSLKNKSIFPILQKLIYAYRHYKTTIILLIQTFRVLPASLRKNITNMIIFKPSKAEWEVINEEMMEIDKKKSRIIYKTVFSKPHEWILINLTSSKMYHKFDEIIYDSDYDSE